MNWPGYAQYRSTNVDWLSEIPASWALSRLGFEAWVRARLGWKGLKADEYVDGGLAFLSTPDIRQREINFDNVARITEARYDESPEIKLTVGDVLLAKDGSTLGAVNVVRSLPEPATVNGSIAVITPGKNLTSGYLHYLISSDFLQGRIQMLKGGMGVPHLFQDDIRRFDIPLPNIEEQLAIADFLDRETVKIDALIAKQEQLIATLREDRTATTTHAVTKGLDANAEMKESGIEWFGVVPSHWTIRSLAQVSKLIQTGPFGSQLHATDYVEGGVPIINPSHIEDRTIRPSTKNAVDSEKASELGRHRLYEGDVVAARRGELGRCAIVGPDAVGYLCGTGSLLIRLDPELIDPDFFQRSFSSYANSERLSQVSEGSTMDNLNAGMVARLRMYLPPMGEQQEVAAFLNDRCETIDAIMAKADEVISTLREYRAALITDAVTGKIDVRGVA